MKSFLWVAAACAALGVTVQLVPPAPPVRPELFGADVISTPDYELNAAFLPDGRTVFFTKSTADMSFWTIVMSRLVGDRWTEPEIAPFSGEHSDADLSVAPDGSRLVFISRRPVPGAPGPAVPHVWFVERTARGWSEPRNAASLNSSAGEYYPSVAADGTVYFESARPGGKGRADVYRARLVNGQYLGARAPRGAAQQSLQRGRRRGGAGSEFHDPDGHGTPRRCGARGPVHFRAARRPLERAEAAGGWHQLSGDGVLPEPLARRPGVLLHEHPRPCGCSPNTAEELLGAGWPSSRHSERPRQCVLGSRHRGTREVTSHRSRPIEEPVRNVIVQLVVAVTAIGSCGGLPLVPLSASAARESAAAARQGAAGARYPAHWWAAIPKEGAPAWEILPQEAGPGEVIVSKRHELGLLSNFAPTPFVFRGKRYASVEGFWQMMLYPEGPGDPRASIPGLSWPHTREQVSQMVGFEAKDAGTAAERNMTRMGIDWVSFEGERFPYRPDRPGRHYELIVAAMREKVRQNPDVQRVLLSTGDLVLKPDHHEEAGAKAAWKYCDILMQIRAERRRPAR